MSVQTSIRPAATEYAKYYGGYVDRVPNGDILELLEKQIAEFTDVLNAVPEEQAGVLHDPYTWTIKQVVGHMIDVEKVFGYRAHRFACGDLRPILGMEQNDFVDNLDYQMPLLSDMVIEMKCARRSNCHFLKRIPEAAWSQAGTADGNLISVRAIAYILVGHVIHHLEIIRKRLTME
ncbi:MAG: DinB family protein [Planctomycetota bacterium]